MWIDDRHSEGDRMMRGRLCQLLAQLACKRPILADGAMATVLMEMAHETVGAGPCACPGGLTHPEWVQDVHRGYVEAGAQILYTNTFSATSQKVIEAAFQNAKVVAKPETLIAGNIGSFLKNYKNILSFHLQNEVDLLAFETFTDHHDIALALKAIQDVKPKVPVLFSISLAPDSDPSPYFKMLSSQFLDIVGLNCSAEPKKMFPTFQKMKKEIQKPIAIKLNAGVPTKKDDGRFVYPVNAINYVEQLKPYLENGVAILGGCCGTTSETISYLKRFSDEE